MEIIRNVVQIASIVLEILLPCYFGEKVRTSFDDLSRSIYEIKWYEQDIRFRKHFVLFLQRVQEEECLMAGGLIPVTLQSFFEVTLKLSIISFRLSKFFISGTENGLLFCYFAQRHNVVYEAKEDELNWMKLCVL